MSVVFESSILVVLRSILFYSCRKFLIRSLYSDLQHIQTHIPPTPGPTTSDDEYIPLDTLPPPANSASIPRRKDSERPRALHSTISRAVFATCFSESCMLFVLLMAQGLEVFDARTRLINWKFSISFLLVTVLILTPLLISLVISLSQSSSSGSGSGAERARSGGRILTPRSFLTLLPLSIYLYLLSLIPLPPALSVAKTDLFMATLARLVVLGTIILGLLSGVGAIAGLEEYAGCFRREKSTPTTRDIEASERALAKVREDLQNRRDEVHRRAGSEGGSSGSSSWVSRVTSKFTGGDEYALEIKGLEALEYQMSLNLEDLRTRYERAKFASTFRGRVIGVFGKLFAAYCAVRIVSSIINLFTPKVLLSIVNKTDKPTQATNYPDLLTKLIGDILSLTSTAEEVDIEAIGSMMRQISLVLVGVIILNSLRIVLRGVTRALRVTSKNLGASLMLLLLAQLMGIYLLSTVVQLRASFPPPAGDAKENANLFSTIPEFQVFGTLFDGAFLSSAVVSGLFRWFRERIQGGEN
ncbi:g protein-coupled receptor 89 [Moniliophthora roreri MCA 2997]|uniref:G protein-coupled receptor 89 n=1 Tax=Moniliophthora roreri (strain MCA 2997) TaxID=1381753 RepID=V2X6V5_MONRO|nr:g protein-coupled receptor 89 [Moniliophthora roreri MCA 2997]